MNSGKKSVFIADDQQEMRDLLGERLRALGKEVTSFSTGTRLAQQLEKEADGVELVVLDLDFGPGEPDGIEILKNIKEQRPELPVIILTGKGSIDAGLRRCSTGLPILSRRTCTSRISWSWAWRRWSACSRCCARMPG